MKDKTKEQLIKELEASETQRRFIEAELSLFQTLVPTINDADDFHLALFAVIKRMCQVTDWIYGEAWVPSSDGKVMERSPAWYSSVKELNRFSKLSERFTFAPGEGLPGRVWQDKKPIWIKDIASEKCFARTGIAAEAGLKSCLAVPVLLRNEVQTVLVFFLPVVSTEDEGLIKIVSTVAAQLGTLIRRKKAEEELRSLKKAVETMQLGVTITDTDGKILYTNPAEARMHGYTVDELLGKNSRTFAPPERWQPIPLQLIKSIKRASVNVRKDGSSFPVQLLSDVVTNVNGEIVGVITTCEDITERRKMEGELLKISKLESLGTLAGGIAHDFNNILTIITGRISLAKMNAKPGEDVFEMLTAAEKGCKRAKDLTQQLITFSKGGLPIKTVVSVIDMIKESADFALRGSNVRYDLQFPDDLRPVEVDEGQINQVINNLIINACHAMPNGGMIKIRAKNVTIGPEDVLSLQEGEYVKISVTDYGTGIPEEHLQKIFDPFFTTKQKGSGLGLATSYSIIRNHGGNITVDSQPGAGATFHIYLPASTKEISKKTTTGGHIRNACGKILIMDDEEMLRDSTADMLGRNGFKVETAGDGIEAIELYKKAKESGDPFDVVIMDLTVPGGMGGKEAVRRLREFDPRVRAVVSSGYSDDAMMSDYRSYGFCGIIVKPYSMDELLKILNQVLNEKEK